LLTWATPLGLLGLVLLPAMRWLHRGGRHRRAVAVSSLALWRAAAASPPAAGARRPPDPAWRRRALLAALLLIALAGPQWAVQRAAVTLWVDDGLSMLTREPAGPGVATRLEVAWAQARSLLDGLGPADVEVRALSDPWRPLGAPTVTLGATLRAGAGKQQPGAPPAALLDPGRAQWLLTDGAHAAVLAWPEGRRPDRIIQVAQVTRNVGIERLSARRDPAQPDQLELLVKLSNGGTAVETRELVLATAAGEFSRSTHRLDAGASALVRTRVPAAAQVRASLQPRDALPEDDELALDLSPLRRRRVAVDPTCSAALRAAVAAHPALALVTPAPPDAQAVLDCGAQAGAARPAQPLPTLRVRADRMPLRPQGLLQWSATLAEAQRIRLDPARLLLAARLQAQPGDAVLLAAGDEAVIIRRQGGSAGLETSLDFEAMAPARGPEIPLLVSLMFEQLLGSRLLDAIAITDRGAAAAQVAPGPQLGTGAGAGATAEQTAGQTAARAAATTTAPQAPRDLAWPVLVLALLVLLWEIAALGRQWRWLGRHTGAPSA
jgi:hypothetical protein